LDHEQVSQVAPGTKRRRLVGGGRGDGNTRCQLAGSGDGLGEQGPAGVFSIPGPGGTGQPVVADLGKPARQNVVEEAVDEFLGWYTHVAELLGAVIAIPEGDLAVLEVLDPAVGDGDPEDVASQVVEDLGAGTGVLAVDDPGLPPDLSANLVIQAHGL